MPSEPIKVFYSYSHKDESFAKDLDKYLVVLKRKKIIETWYDRRIDAGQEWKNKITEELNQAQIILLLISIDFLNSEYCINIELAQAKDKYELGEAVIVPIILKKIPNIEYTPFSRYQFLPKDGKPVDHWKNRNDAWVNIAEGITKICHDFLNQRSKRSNADILNAQTIRIQMLMDNQKREMQLWKMLHESGVDSQRTSEILEEIKVNRARATEKIWNKYNEFFQCSDSK